MRYKIKNLEKYILIAVVTLLTAGMYAYFYCLDTGIVSEDVKRPEINSEDKILPVRVKVDEDVSFDTDIVISPRKYSEDNIEKAFDMAEDVLDTVMLGDNRSADNVTGKLNFSDTIEGYPFSVQWVCDDYELIDYDGSVNNINFSQGESREVVLQCVLRYEGWERRKEYYITVKAPDMNDADVKKKRIKERINEAVGDEPEGEYAELPESADGMMISYEKRSDWNSVFVIIMLGIAAAAVVYTGEKKKAADDIKKRTKELKRDYSEMIHKLTLLMGAGMTVRMSWEYIVNDYKKMTQNGRVREKVVYEEMTHTLYQLCSGVSEINAYNEFGERCGTKEYKKFSSLITQNLQKGSRELVKLLELEAVDAFEERKNIARKYGEEAGTKMLFPMVMMLVVVMGIIMVPAVMNFTM